MLKMSHVNNVKSRNSSSNMLHIKNWIIL